MPAMAGYVLAGVASKLSKALHMDLTTRCPQCGVEFPVSLEQLQLRKGYIRCINCANIFDGYEAVVPASGAEFTVSSAADAAQPAHEPQFSTPPPRSTPAMAEPQFVIPSSGQGGHVPIRTREASEPAVMTPDESHLSGQFQGHTIGDDDLMSGHDSPQYDGNAGLYIEPRQRRHPGAVPSRSETSSGFGVGGVLLSLLIFLGVAGAVLQAAYIYRVQLASEVPALRPALERYCEMLNCTVDYPRRLAQIAVMDSSLQAVRENDTAADANTDEIHMVLDVVVRNNFDKPQQWPYLSLELVDFSGVVAVRRSLAPADYLPELSLQRPFPAKSEVRVSVPITIDGVRINGYQLNTFFP